MSHLFLEYQYRCIDYWERTDVEAWSYLWWRNALIESDELTLEFRETAIECGKIVTFLGGFMKHDLFWFTMVRN